MKRRTVLLVAVMTGTMLLAAVAGVALAKTFTCEPGSTDVDPCKGTRKGDNITGTEGRDWIYAKKGRDTVHSLGVGNSSSYDSVYGGGGNDVIYGEPGADDLYGDGGDDLMFGGLGGDDWSNPDAMYGREGNDRLYDISGPKYGEPADYDEVCGGPGRDDIDVTDGDNLDRIGADVYDIVVKDAGDVIDDAAC